VRNIVRWIQSRVLEPLTPRRQRGDGPVAGYSAVAVAVAVAVPGEDNGWLGIDQVCSSEDSFAVGSDARTDLER